MCSRVDCRNCGKATWQGCGMHVRCALFGVEEKDRCPNWRDGIYRPCEVGTNAPKEATNERK